VWREAAPGERLEVLGKAAHLENFMHRVKDVPAVLDQPPSPIARCPVTKTAAIRTITASSSRSAQPSGTPT